MQMIEYMDGIVAAVEDFAQTAKDVAITFITALCTAATTAIIMLVKAALLITAPAWVLPYAIFRDLQRDNNGGRCEKPDCESCPFPQCRERSGRE